jgi:hypothetical protein
MGRLERAPLAVEGVLESTGRPHTLVVLVAQQGLSSPPVAAVAPLAQAATARTVGLELIKTPRMVTAAVAAAVTAADRVPPEERHRH